MASPLDHSDQFVILDKTTTSGPFGPQISWQPGLTFNCLLTFNSSMEARVAEQAGVTSLFSGLCEKNIPIEFHTVFKRVSDGATFRVTSEPKDDESPEIASFSVKAFTAEKYELPAS